ncbi:MAG: hypothetical protein STSR0004_23000 [Peptococcaceae bacterium]|jgi:hypothetical protein
MRDDFDLKIKETLAKRVGYRCSNPNCRILTCGPQEEAEKTINIGVASHICAASPGGPRYDKNQTPEERKSIDNGIWLCQTHAKLIDNDEKRYSVDILKQWKKLSENAALLELENINVDLQDDIQLIKSYMPFFDRPAFQHPFIQEGSMEDFDRAIEDTIIALNTGTVRSRNGEILHKTNGKSYINNLIWREKLNVIVDMLVALRERYALAIQNKEISISDRKDNTQWYCINNHELSEWFDFTRSEIINIFSDICSEAGLKPDYHFPRYRRGW